MRYALMRNSEEQRRFEDVLLLLAGLLAVLLLSFDGRWSMFWFRFRQVGAAGRLDAIEAV